MGASSSGTSFTFINSDLVTTNCISATNCQTFIQNPRNLNQGCVADVLMNKINAQSSLGSNIFTFDQTSSTLKTGLISINCIGSASCTNTITFGGDCPAYTKYNVIDCSTGGTCINTISHNHLISIQCVSAFRCTNTITNATTTSPQFPQINC